MVNTLCLNGAWQVTWTEGLHGRWEHGAAPELDGQRYIPIAVPGEIHRELQRAGLLDDPNIGLNSLKARWVEEQVWVYRRVFNAPPKAASSPCRLSFESLDLNAVVFLNGEEIGRHGNVHRPCHIDVTGKLRPGENTLVVVLESGLYDVADREGAAYNQAPETLLNKRHWMRKAQYQAGWDWNPRLINVGIVGSVRLEWSTTPWIEELVVLPELAPDHRSAMLWVRAHVTNPAGEPVQLRLLASADDPGGNAVASESAEFTAEAGESVAEVHLPIDSPDLWWPVGHGAQSLYAVSASLKLGSDTVSERNARTGIRSVEIDRSPHPQVGDYFIIKVNGRPIFCKGGNWVPPDMLAPQGDSEAGGLAEDMDARCRALVDLAVEANCNLLRIWGGGYYVGDRLLDCCDEAGVLVWHDLAFACSKYPADDPAFLAEVRREIRWNVRKMANHPSLVVWCGNNELEWGVWAWGYDRSGKTLPDYSLFHHVIPVILKEEDTSRPYWPSSPYSEGHRFPNEPTTGDQHPWDVTLGQYGTDFWAYRNFVDRFPNEGGVLGASSPATLQQCLGDQFAFRSFAWEHHDNAANFWRADEGVTYRAVLDWLGLEADRMELADYCFASALLQAEGLCEYIGNYRRRMFSSSSAIFWMYNDSWPATHGWTIVDYYLRRKLAFHPVRRAFQPVSAVVAEDEGTVTVFGVNDSPNDWTGDLRFGLFRFDGGLPLDDSRPVTLPANASTPLAKISRADWEQQGFAQSGAFAALLADGRVIAQHRLLLERFKDLALAQPEIEMALAEDGLTLTLRSDVFAWGVCLDLNGETPLPDNCFDLLPGIERTMAWSPELGEPKVVALGNDLVIGR